MAIVTTTAKTLEQTKGKFKVVGKIKGIDNEKAYRQGVTKNGDDYNSINFLIETAPNNTLAVELFGMKTDNVLVMNFKEKDKRKKKKYVDWDDRYEDHGDYELVGTVTVKDDASKKKGDRLLQYEAVETIFENFEEGEWVECRGQIDFESWETDEGEVKTRYKLKMNMLVKIKDRNFEDEKFKEVNEFAQTIVVTELEVDKESNRLIILAKIIDYQSNCIDTSLVIDIEKYKKLATNLKKRLKFGDQIRLVGKIRNETEFIQVEEEADDEEDWGGDSVSIEEEYQRNQIRELLVTGVVKKTHIEGKYTEEDLFNEDEENFGSDEDDLEDDDDIEIDENDLPFDEDEDDD
jgi:single-stranded DNA-binding protein